MMHSCQDITEVVTEYLEGRMGWYDWARFQLHLGMCLACRGYIQQMQTTIDTLGKLEKEDIPPEVHEALTQRFRDWHKGQECDPR